MTVEDDDDAGASEMNDDDANDNDWCDKGRGATFTILAADHTLGNMLAAAAEAHPSTLFAASRCERVGVPKVVLRIDCGTHDTPKNVFVSSVEKTVATLSNLRASWNQ